MNPIVSSEGEVIDGYNRIAQAIQNGEKTIKVFRGVKVVEAPLPEAKNELDKVRERINNIKAASQEGKLLEDSYPGELKELQEREKNLLSKKPVISFSEAGEKAKSEGKADSLADFLLENSKVGDTITDKEGNGYEVKEVNTRKDGTKELVIVPFEIIDGKKDYNQAEIGRAHV